MIAIGVCGMLIEAQIPPRLPEATAGQGLSPETAMGKD